MQVYLERSGGVTGIRAKRCLSSDDLAPAERQQLQTMLDAAGFFNLPETMRAPQPDRFHYKMTVETDEKKRTIEADESAIPPTLRPLLDWVMRSGRKI